MTTRFPILQCKRCGGMFLLPWSIDGKGSMAFQSCTFNCPVCRHGLPVPFMAFGKGEFTFMADARDVVAFLSVVAAELEALASGASTGRVLTIDASKIPSSLRWLAVLAAKNPGLAIKATFGIMSAIGCIIAFFASQRHELRLQSREHIHEEESQLREHQHETVMQLREFEERHLQSIDEAISRLSRSDEVLAGSSREAAATMRAAIELYDNVRSSEFHSYESLCEAVNRYNELLVRIHAMQADLLHRQLPTDSEIKTRNRNPSELRHKAGAAKGSSTL